MTAEPAPDHHILVVPDLRSVLPVDAFTYSVPEEMVGLALPGRRVEVPFGSRTSLGFVVGRQERPSRTGETRAINAVVDEEPLLLPHHIALAQLVATRYCAPLGEVIKAMVPAGVRRAKPGRRRRGPRTMSVAIAAAHNHGDDASVAPPLSDAQNSALVPLLAAISEHRHRRVLLHGVTGSGKTEVYLAAIDAALDAGRQAIVLVPEIALTPQMIHRFAGRFPGRVALIHSALTESERAAEWHRIRAGDASVVVGSRSAVFAPLERLGIVVIDEEDSTAYKQDRVPRYHAVDVALELGRLCDAPVVLGSATPRVETFFAAHTGALELTELPARITGRPMPPIEVVDLREELLAGNRSPLSQTLDRALEECFTAGGQSILFLNRRGTATVVMCRNCGNVLSCQNCSVSLVYHATRRRCDCHYCGASASLPTVCPECGSTAIRQLGMGTQRLESEVAQRFPGMRLLRMDRDTVTERDAYFQIYDDFREGRADCLIGTQMVAKGWDLGRVRLVGIVNADTSLHFPDYRAGETTFSLLTQVAGRAGRGDEPARVVLQTYSPEHYAVHHAKTHDYLAFARDEIRIRKLHRFPPYARMVVCTMTNSDDAAAEARCLAALQQVRAALEMHGDIDTFGPTPAFVHRVRGEFRWQFTVKGTRIERCFPHLPTGRGWITDVDPAM